MDFPVALREIQGISACLIGRIPGVETAVEREEAMARLAPFQSAVLRELGPGNSPLITAEQVHGANVAVVRADRFPSHPVPGVDGLVTTHRGITLGIFVADCAPVWIVAKDGRAGALVHSGKKGTELGVIPAAMRSLRTLAGLAPSDLVMVIGPCIRPPCYEVDFAAMIRFQALEAGIAEIHDDGTCTACHPERYYSYRRERGLTGRMLATLTLLSS